MRTGIFSLASFALLAGLIGGCGTAKVGFEAQSTDPNDSNGTGGFGDDDDDTKPASNKCSDNEVEFERVPVVIEFVIDQSGSMDSNGKWTAATSAISAAFDSMQLTADPATYVGAMLFNTSPGEKVAPGPMTDVDHYDELKDFIDSAKTTGTTGTESALKSAYSIVQRWKPPANSGLSKDNIKRVVILLSDGLPDGSQCKSGACFDLAEEMLNDPDAPVLTFAVGIGPFPGTSGYDPKFMGDLAVAGGTAPAACDSASTDIYSVCHYQITPGGDVDATRDALVTALNSIRALSASCEFTFDMNENVDLSGTKVWITDEQGNKSEIPKSDENGWSYDDPSNPSKIILNGDSCANSNANATGRVDIEIPCKIAN